MKKSLNEKTLSASVGRDLRSPLRLEPTAHSAFIDPWVTRCAEFSSREGFRYFVFGLIVPRLEGKSVQFVLTNYPSTWLKTYDDCGYITIDPVAARLLTSISPFAWEDLKGGGSKEAAFWKNAADHGLRWGYTVPVHGPRGQHAAIALAGVDEPLQIDARQPLYERAWTFTVCLLEEIFGTYLQHDGLSQTAPLNPKQRDALSLISKGLSIKEISDRLSLHPRTVEYHLGSAMKKLGAATREQAIVRALLSGDIEELSYPSRLRDWCLRIGT